MDRLSVRDLHSRHDHDLPENGPHLAGGGALPRARALPLLALDRRRHPADARGRYSAPDRPTEMEGPPRPPPKRSRAGGLTLLTSGRGGTLYLVLVGPKAHGLW